MVAAQRGVNSPREFFLKSFLPPIILIWNIECSLHFEIIFEVFFVLRSQISALRPWTMTVRLLLVVIAALWGNRVDFLIQFTIEAIYAGHAAARRRVKQYTQLLRLLQREADEWLRRCHR
jgi:hypothetical protein